MHSDSHYVDLLAANKYYVVPVVNVDGLADIEKIFLETGEMTTRRKNMNPNNSANCSSDQRGVDLNRNYAVYWDKPGGNSPDPCN